MHLEVEVRSGVDPNLLRYHKPTIALLRKYMRMSTELGHLPSLIGREFFRSHVSVYSTHTFEDIVIFTHDMDRCLEKLNDEERMVIARVELQEHTLEETARLMNCPLRTMCRLHRQALDNLAKIFVERKMMQPLELMPEELLDAAIQEDINQKNWMRKKPPQSVKLEVAESKKA